MTADKRIGLPEVYHVHNMVFDCPIPQDFTYKFPKGRFLTQAQAEVILLALDKVDRWLRGLGFSHYDVNRALDIMRGKSKCAHDWVSAFVQTDLKTPMKLGFRRCLKCGATEEGDSGT